MKGLLFAALLVRWLVALHGVSGYQEAPKNGDFEAQRHWMEIAIHIPVSQWYTNSTTNPFEHWGLDYPPLSGYLSFVFGKM